MTTDIVQELRNRRRVRVSFGGCVIAEFISNDAHATRFEDALRQRFAGLSITSDALPSQPTGGLSR